MALVLLDRGSDGVATVTLNRPEAMNAISRALARELAQALAEADEDPSIRVMVLTGAGDRAFSAGVDLKEVEVSGIAVDDPTLDWREPVLTLSACRKPVIAAINGVAITGGLELAIACDILVASTTARFADTHVRVGVTPGWGLSQVLPRTIGFYRATEMSLTGNFIDAQTALAWGLVNRVVAPEGLMPVARALAADIAACDPDMVVRYKALIGDGYALALGEARALEEARSRIDNATLDPQALAQRRADVVSRGRVQQR